MSASSNNTRGVSMRSSPCCSAHSLPVQPCGGVVPATTVRQGNPLERAMDAVASVDWSSITMTRAAGAAIASARNVSPITCASLRAGINTAKSAGDAGGFESASRCSRQSQAAHGASITPAQHASARAARIRMAMAAC